MMRRERADSIGAPEEITLPLKAGYMCAVMTFICLRDEEPLASREGSIYGWTAFRMRLHVAFAASGPFAPFATPATRPRPTPTGDYPPRASHFPGGQR